MRIYRRPKVSSPLYLSKDVLYARMKGSGVTIEGLEAIKAKAIAQAASYISVAEEKNQNKRAKV